MTDEELKLIGLTQKPTPGLLDTDSKVLQLKEELSKRMEEPAKQWEAAKRNSQKEGTRHFYGACDFGNRPATKPVSKSSRH